MLATLRVLIAFLLGMLLPWTLQAWDRRRLTDEQRARAWNAASWGSALYAFGPLSMLGWCWVTRHAWGRWRDESTLHLIGKSAALLLFGVTASVAVIAVIIGVDELIGLAAGE